MPYQTFKTKDGHLVDAAFTEKFWHGLCRALELPELIDDARFVNNDARREHRAELVPILSRVFLARTTSEWQTRLDAESVPWGPINTIDRVFADPQVIARAMQIAVNHPTIGALPMLGNPVKIAQENELRAPPLLGQHTEKVLREILGYAPEKIARLEEQKIIRAENLS
ncbi:MAG: CoA transferase [Chloroflexi bacterium]|nr:CoA transferase [Chloroflexota bacterium]